MKRPAPLATALLVGTLAACPTSPPTPPSPPDDELFTHGDPQELIVEADGYTEITEPVSGLTFVFPDGGSGSLTIAVIDAAPSWPFLDGEGFGVAFSGEARFALKVPPNDDREVLLYAWGDAPGSVESAIPMASAEMWFPIGTTSIGGTTVFPLLPSPAAAPALPGAALRSSALTDPTIYAEYAIKKLPATLSIANGATTLTVSYDEYLATKASIEALVAASVATWTANMSEPARAAATANLTSIPYRVQLHLCTGEATPLISSCNINYYGGGWWITGVGYATNPTIYFVYDAVAQSDTSVAHEAGHLMNHMLWGSTDYRDLEASAPGDHAVNESYEASENTVLEEYGYFSQVMIKGSLNSADPVTNPRGVLSGANPGVVDVPNLEGFMALLLAVLHAGPAELPSIPAGIREPVPPVGASWTELIDIIATKPKSRAALIVAIDGTIGEAGSSAELSVIAERLGWSYHGRGRVLDTSGNAVAGARVEAIRAVAATVYGMQADESALSGADGSFAISRMFPGETTLRVTTADGVVLDFPVPTGWDTPTTTELSLTDMIIPGCKYGSGRAAVITFEAQSNSCYGAGEFSLCFLPGADGSVAKSSTPGCESFDDAFEVSGTWSCDAVTLTYNITSSTPDWITGCQPGEVNHNLNYAGTVELAWNSESQAFQVGTNSGTFTDSYSSDTCITEFPTCTGTDLVVVSAR